MRGVCSIDYLEKNKHSAQEVVKYQWGSVYNDILQVPKGAYDALIEATGFSFLASTAQSFLKSTGKVLIFGVPENKITVDAFDMFKNEISYIGSYTSKKDSMKEISCVQTKLIKVEDLVSDIISIDEVPKYIERLE